MTVVAAIGGPRYCPLCGAGLVPRGCRGSARPNACWCGGIALWRIEIQVNQLLAVSGEENSSTNENHIVLKGQLDTANTSFARIVAENLFGLGKNSAPGDHGSHRGRPRRHCRRISGGDAAIPGRQPRSGVTVSLRPDVRVLHARGDRGDRAAHRRQGEDRDRRAGLSAAGGEAARLRSLPTDSGTALDVAGNGRYARKVVVACKRERARRLHTVAPAELAEVAKTDRSVLVVNDDDMARALASALA